MRTDGTAHILVVEDNRADVMLLQLALKRADGGCIVEALSDGEAAMLHLGGLAASPADTPRLVVVDLGLPRLDGAAVLEAVRQLSHLRNVKLAALSGWASPGQVARISRMGVPFYQKPDGLEGWMRLAEELMGHCRPDAGCARG